MTGQTVGHATQWRPEAAVTGTAPLSVIKNSEPSSRFPIATSIITRTTACRDKMKCKNISCWHNLPTVISCLCFNPAYSE